MYYIIIIREDGSILTLHFVTHEEADGAFKAVSSDPDAGITYAQFGAPFVFINSYSRDR